MWFLGHFWGISCPIWSNFGPWGHPGVICSTLEANKGVFWVSTHDSNKNFGWCTKKMFFGLFGACLANFGSLGLPSVHLYQKFKKAWFFGFLGHVQPILGLWGCPEFICIKKGIYWVSTYDTNKNGCCTKKWILGHFWPIFGPWGCPEVICETLLKLTSVFLVGI